MIVCFGMRSTTSTRLRLGEEGPDPYLASLTPAERIGMMWTLAVQAWMFKEGVLREPRLRRDVGRVVRGRR
jgi:hypothetical protein